MLPRSMMSSGSRGQQGQEDEGWANASPGQAERGFAGRSEAAAPAGMPGVCAQGCMGAGMQVDPWAAYLQQQRFLQQQAYGQTVEFLMVIKFLCLNRQAKRRMDQVHRT